ncbi:MAG TPA: DUF3106 domain-containing protein [Verrucomicrobiae bacterium]|nr:DUF3106 domain-containing protein [Verrucomicrobiae bacterium]
MIPRGISRDGQGSLRRSAQRIVAALSVLVLMFAVEAQDKGGVTRSVESLKRIAGTEGGSGKSPVEQFRDLLAMPVSERRQSLSNRPPELRRQILAKVREYESLKPAERELRLQATELRWYLLPLMSEPRTNRAARLAVIPLPQRELVERRLEQWDLLPPTFQEELLNSETTARYFSQLQSATREQRRRVLNQMSPERRARLEAGLDTWRVLPEAQRQKMLASFSAFFELQPEEKARALDKLTDAEKQQMEKTLAAYEKLTPQQRAECIRSFQKFASLSLPERQAFLKNAERWKLMSAEEREEWRSLVEVAPIQPPLPIGFEPAPPPPPIP